LYFTDLELGTRWRWTFRWPQPFWSGSRWV